MDGFQRALTAIGSIKTPITVTALIVIVFYYLVHQMLGLGVFSNLSQADTSHLLQSILDKVFWLAVLGLIFGGVLFALPHIMPKRFRSAVAIVDEGLNKDLSSYTQSPDRTGPISRSD